MRANPWWRRSRAIGAGWHIELSPSNDLMLSTSNDCALLWDLKSGTYAKKNLAGGAYGAVQARFAGANGEKAVVAFHDESLWVWNARTGNLERKLEAPDLGARSPAKGPTLCQSIAISRDSRYVVTAGGSPCLFVWDLTEGKMKHAVELPRGSDDVRRRELAAPAAGGGRRRGTLRRRGVRRRAPCAWWTPCGAW